MNYLIKERIPLVKQINWNLKRMKQNETKETFNYGPAKILQFLINQHPKTKIASPIQDLEETKEEENETKKENKENEGDLSGYLYFKSENQMLERYWCVLVNEELYCILKLLI